MSMPQNKRGKVKEQLRYIGRYIRRPAIGINRIEAYDGQFVTFTYKDKTDGKVKNEIAAKSILILQKKKAEISAPKHALLVQLPKLSDYESTRPVMGQMDKWFETEKIFFELKTRYYQGISIIPVWDK